MIVLLKRILFLSEIKILSRKENKENRNWNSNENKSLQNIVCGTSDCRQSCDKTIKPCIHAYTYEHSNDVSFPFEEVLFQC